jgi:hypothetical protein
MTMSFTYFVVCFFPSSSLFSPFLSMIKKKKIDKLIIPLMMEAEMVSETLGFCLQLTRLVAREDFIEFSHLESFKSYKKKIMIHEADYDKGGRSVKQMMLLIT